MTCHKFVDATDEYIAAELTSIVFSLASIGTALGGLNGLDGRALALQSTGGNELMLQALLALGKHFAKLEESIEGTGDLDEEAAWQLHEKTAHKLIFEGSLHQLLPIAETLLQLPQEELSCTPWP